jgi:hypothetical protein
MDHVPDVVKSVTCLNADASGEYFPLTGQSPFRHWKRHLILSINKLLQTRSVMNYRAVSPFTSLLGFTFQHQVLIQHPRGSQCDCTFAKHFCTKFPEGDMDHYGFRTGFNVSEIPTLPILAVLQTKGLPAVE